MKNTNYIQKGYHAVSPTLAIRNARKAIEWYKTIFGAKEIMRLDNPDGSIAHAELEIGDSMIMLSEENPDFNSSPEMLGGTSVILNIYVPDVDATSNEALNNGAKMIFPVKDQFYGDRSGRIQDPFGHMWIISTNIKAMTPEEMKEEYEQLLKKEQSV